MSINGIARHCIQDEEKREPYKTRNISANLNRLINIILGAGAADSVRSPPGETEMNIIKVNYNWKKKAPANNSKPRVRKPTDFCAPHRDRIGGRSVGVYLNEFDYFDIHSFRRARFDIYEPFSCYLPARETFIFLITCDCDGWFSI